jgi:hypothetical protein
VVIPGPLKDLRPYLKIARFVSLLVFFMELLLFVMGIIYNVPPIRSKEIPYIKRKLPGIFINIIRPA